MPFEPKLQSFLPVDRLRQRRPPESLRWARIEMSPRSSLLQGTVAARKRVHQRIPPSETPRWNDRCDIKNTTKLGIVAITDAANNGPHWVVCSPMKKFSAIGSVRWVGELISVSAMTNSSHAKLNVNIATTASAASDANTTVTRTVPRATSMLLKK